METAVTKDSLVRLIASARETRKNILIAAETKPTLESMLHHIQVSLGLAIIRGSKQLPVMSLTARRDYIPSNVTSLPFPTALIGLAKELHELLERLSLPTVIRWYNGDEPQFGEDAAGRPMIFIDIAAIPK